MLAVAFNGAVAECSFLEILNVVKPRKESKNSENAIRRQTLNDGRHWLRQLVHEYAHFRQWKEQSELWQKKEFEFSQVALLGDRQDDQARRSMIRFRLANRELELDCERRSVNIIIEWNLPLDVGAFIQLANMHIWSHTLEIERLRSCEPHKKPVRFHAHFVDACPDTFLDNYDIVPDFLRESARRR